MAEPADSEGEIEALIHPTEDGRFWAEIVGLAGCYAQGDNYSKIMARLRDAHEVCSRAAAAPTPAAAELACDDGASVGDLAAALTANGWGNTEGGSEAHQLFSQEGTGALLCLPSDSDEQLNPGFHQALMRYLGVHAQADA
ncbi:MAG: type II toxin-antitoxin system HicB family antitoxin [Verrucomicrobiales bacterium]